MSSSSPGFRVRVRAEQQRDRAAVRAINESAFETPTEADLVEALREQAEPIVSLVAEHRGVAAGHIMFSPVVLSGHPDLRLMGLAPMAVAPDCQRQGVGSALVRAGLEECVKLGCGAVVVLGHPEYYPRFGFEPAVRYGVGCEYEVPAEVFMLLELEPGQLDQVAGIAKYHPAFAGL